MHYSTHVKHSTHILGPSRLFPACGRSVIYSPSNSCTHHVRPGDKCNLSLLKMASADIFVRKEFITHLFRQEVQSVSCESGNKPGDNYMSSILSVVVKLGEAGGSQSSKSILIKSYPENQAKREFLESAALFKTEYLVYTEFLPALNRLADEISEGSSWRNDEGAYDFHVNAAKLFGGNIVGDKSIFKTCPWKNENFLVLEDLRARGYIMLDRRKGLDLEHSLLVMKQLANLHALSWVYKRRSQEEYLVTHHPYLEDALYREENGDGWRLVIESFNKNALQVIREEFGESSYIFSRLQSLFSLDVMAVIRSYLSGTGVDEYEAENLLRIPPPESTSDSEEDPWVVATHGDAWINNLLFSYSETEPEKPASALLIDHQAFREACLTTDLAYFLYSSARSSVRKQSIFVLLQAYYSRVVEICEALEVQPPGGFTFQNLLRRWRRTRVFALLMSIVFLSFTLKPHEEGPSDEGTKDSGDIEDAYSDVVDGTKNNEEWRKAIIDLVVTEYDDGVL